MINIMQRRSFVNSLFDISFSNFVTVKVVGILYVVGLIIATLACSSILISSFNGFGNILYGLIAAPLLWAVYVIVMRVSLEALVAAIKTSENTAQILEIMREKR
jgi:uncharacterized membrane protein